MSLNADPKTDPEPKAMKTPDRGSSKISYPQEPCIYIYIYMSPEPEIGLFWPKGLVSTWVTLRCSKYGLVFKIRLFQFSLKIEDFLQ